MRFYFPIILDEDFRSENSSGLGIRALTGAIVMKINHMAGIVCLAAGLVFSVNAWGYTCIGKDGRKSFQDTPCPIISESPVSPGKSDKDSAQADAPSLENALETIRRYTEAMNAKDPAAAMRFVSDTFKGEVYFPTGEAVVIDANGLAALLSEIRAFERYHVEHSCTHQGSAAGKKELVFVCRTTERGKPSGGKELLTKSRETIRIISRGGKTLIDGSITRVESMGEVR
ncbi:MAG: hypothetical protein FWF20_00110 [Betaproteobacteria bacterium]|nr:hypothetical protein [Betaproteobacteria bacterium]MCL2885184.1 hypothetical protein [Betaproteobacteria bacterium]